MGLALFLRDAPGRLQPDLPAASRRSRRGGDCIFYGAVAAAEGLLLAVFGRFSRKIYFWAHLLFNIHNLLKIFTKKYDMMRQAKKRHA